MQVRDSVPELLVQRFVNDDDWVDDAACLATEVDPIDRRGAETIAEYFCPDCPVKKQCLRVLVETDVPGNASVGVFGGFNRWRASSQEARATFSDMEDM